MNDILVTASRGVDNDDLERVEPFDLRLLKRYSPAIVSGWIAEEATIDEEGCRKLALAEAYEQLERRIGAFLPGDERQSLSHDTKLEHESQLGMLLPLWDRGLQVRRGQAAAAHLLQRPVGEGGGQDAGLVAEGRARGAVRARARRPRRAARDPARAARSAHLGGPPMNALAAEQVRCTRCACLVEPGDLRCAVCGLPPEQGALAPREAECESSAAATATRRSLTT